MRVDQALKALYSISCHSLGCGFERDVLYSLSKVVCHTLQPGTMILLTSKNGFQSG